MENFYQVFDVEEALAYFAEQGYPVPFLLKLNGSERIEVGDVLLLRKPEGRPYRVRPFETAESVGRKFGISPAEILEKNRISQLTPFQEIYL